MKRSRCALLLWAALFAALTLPVACGSDDEQDDKPAWMKARCPGDSNCRDEGAGTLFAGVSVVDLTPTDLKEGPSLVDANGDGLYNSEDGDTFDDANGNNKMDAMWIAGFDASRPAMGVHDPIEGRILALSYNDTMVVWIVVDFAGFFYDYKLEVESRVDPAVRARIDLVVASAIHTHQGPDTIGLWGRKLNESGLDLEYLDMVYGRLAQGVNEAVGSLQEVHATFGAIQVEDANGNTEHYVGDHRDPAIIDKTMNVMRLFNPADDETVATVVNFASHAEFAGDSNNLLSADFPYYLRNAVESGDSTGIRGIGGVCFYVTGAVGAQIGPDGVVPVDREGNPVPVDTFEAARAVGESYAGFALDALKPENGAVTVEAPPVSFRTREVYAAVDNFLYQAAWRLGIFNRELHNFDPEAYIEEGNIPEVLTELVYLKIGPAGMISIPGELAPELFIGCYDGSCTGGRAIIDPGRPYPPDLSRAPEGPYIRDLMAANGDQFQWCLGLTQDEVGYILPDYDYILDEGSPYMEEAPGEHYEETNSLGPDARAQLIDPLEELITYVFPAER